MITLAPARRFASSTPSPRFAGAYVARLILTGAALLAVGCGPETATPDDAVPSVTPNASSMLGYNLDFPGDWTNVPPFIDQMKNSRAPFGSCPDEDQECDPASHLDLDARGWPRSLAYRDDPSLEYASIQFVISSSEERSDIGETFVVTWEGRADINLINGADAEQDEGRNRLTFTLQPDVTQLRLTNIDPDGTGDYVRNVRVFRSDFESLLDRGEIFNPDMLAFLEPFRSIRFMDWMQSNAYGECSGGSNAGGECYPVILADECGGGGRCLIPGRWNERPTSDAPSSLSYGQYLDPSRPELGTRVGGYSLEIMVALANRVPADPHFNIPADYDEEYVRNFATYLRDHLAPGLTASVEYSNEVWNFGFPQAQYANELGRALWPDEGTAWLQYMAGRTHTMCGIMKQVFAGQEQRLRCLISPQTGWLDVAETVLDCPMWAADHPGQGACDANLDAINITGYFAGCLISENEQVLDWLGDGKQVALDRAFEQLEHGSLIEGCTGDGEDNLDHTIENYRSFGELAASRGLGLYIYESGTHFNLPGDADPAVHDLLVDVTRDPRMYDLYTKNFQGFSDAGGSVMNVWGWVARDDMWANADSLLDRSHPKYRAIRDFSSR